MSWLASQQAGVHRTSSGGLDYAREIGAFAIGFSCNQDAALKPHADLNIIPLVGPEVLSGSTRLKAGTATKMVLNMLTTGAMVRMGKTYSNLMVDLCATNEKLGERAQRIVKELTDCTGSEAGELLQHCDGEVKTAIVSQNLGIAPQAARTRLESWVDSCVVHWNHLMLATINLESLFK